MSSSLTGRRGWTAVASLTAVLSGLVAFQLPTASAAEVPRTAVPASVPAVAPAVLPAVAPVVFGPRAAATPSTVAAALPTSLAAAPLVLQRASARVTAAQAAAAAATRAAAVAAAAEATAEAECSGAGWQARRGAAALATLAGGEGQAGYRVEFKGSRPGYLGLTHLDAKRIELFVRPCTGPASFELLRHAVAHELGHAHDTEFMTAATRRAWLQARGISPRNWYGCDGCTDFATPAGDFAEVYAQWARGASTNKSQLAGDVPPAELQRLAKRFFAA